MSDRDELKKLMDFLREQPKAPNAPMVERRRIYDAAAESFGVPEGVTVNPWRSGELKGEWLAISGARADRKLLYLHGGGYGIGSPDSHRHLAAALGIAAGADVLLPDYRLAPEHPFPAALDDAFGAYGSLADNARGASIVVAGDSAGGGLAISLLMRIRDELMQMPVAGVCISPWADLVFEAGSEVAKATEDDPVVKYDAVVEYIANYVGDAAPDNPLISPVYGDLRQLPPLLIHASEVEALRFDAIELARHARSAGVEAILEMTDGAPHVWHWFWPRSQVARNSIERIGRWLDDRW